MGEKSSKVIETLPLIRLCFDYLLRQVHIYVPTCDVGGVQRTIRGAKVEVYNEVRVSGVSEMLSFNGKTGSRVD